MKSKNTNKNIKFYIKDIRCFKGKQEFDIRPLTFLVGENSTGKTTVLGCFNVLYNAIAQPRDSLYFENNVDFNIPPYDMGAFESIVRKTTNKKLKNKFQIGFESQQPNVAVKISFVKDPKRAEPIVECIDIKHDSNSFILDYKSKKITYKLKSEIKRTISFPEFLKEEDEFIPPRHMLFLMRRDFEKNKKKDDTIKTIIRNMQNDIDRCLKKMKNLSPVRSKPQRTYNPVREAPNPEGREVPMYLMRISTSNKKGWKELSNQLILFGKASGMFSDIQVGKYRKKSISGPFELQFSIRGVQSNIMDIGYGVSQVLPLLIRMFQRHNTNFLLQQPEVHLHPKAQAELSSLFIRSINNKQNHSFLIETHSDYMVDRARIEIQRGKIDPDQVSVIYLETLKDGSVKAHNISFDQQGNVLNAPSNYRSFFLKEMDRTLGLDK